MASAEFSATIDASGNHRAAIGNLSAPVTAAIAVLVADGASPTQAHVTTLNTAWAAFIAKDVTVFIGSTTNVNTKNKLCAALAAITRAALGTNLLAD